MLKIKNIKKSYDKRTVVNEINMSIERGEIIGFFGKNGAGKTTTFKIILGVIEPDYGNIYLDKINITNMPPHERANKGITYLPQEPSIFKKGSVIDNFKIILEEKNIPKSEIDNIIDSTLNEFNISYLKDEMSYNVSGGERRRIEIARALLINPSFFLLDEPFSGIDPLSIIDLQNLVRKLSLKGIGIIISDHNVYDSFEIVNRAYILEEGKIIAKGTPEELVANPIAREKFLGKDFSLI